MKLAPPDQVLPAFIMIAMPLGVLQVAVGDAVLSAQEHRCPSFLLPAAHMATAAISCRSVRMVRMGRA